MKKPRIFILLKNEEELSFKHNEIEIDYKNRIFKNIEYKKLKTIIPFESVTYYYVTNNYIREKENEDTKRDVI